MGIIGQPLFLSWIAIILQGKASSVNCSVMQLAKSAIRVSGFDINPSLGLDERGAMHSDNTLFKFQIHNNDNQSPHSCVRQSATVLLQSAMIITKCDRTNDSSNFFPTRKKQLT